MNILAKAFFITLIFGTLIVAACSKEQQTIPSKQTPKASESAILDIPEEDIVPKEITTKQVLPVETPEPAQTLSIQQQEQ